jgi:hypothetical protein
VKKRIFLKKSILFLHLKIAMPASKKKKKAIIDYGPFSDLRNYDLSKAVLSGNDFLDACMWISLEGGGR